MRLHRLELEGFGPFRARQVVDFDALAPDGIFLIAGRTGAGKSSILDGVCFALYGGVPRYEAAERRVRSDHSAPDEPTRAVLELTIADARWRVTRSPEFERPKRRGDGVTKVAADALLEEQVGGEWIGRAAGPRDVALALDEALGLTQQQFLQVVLLAQNRFSQFLLAKNDERQKVLRTLFGTRVHEEYERRLDERRRASEQERRLDEGLLVQLRDDVARLADEHGIGDPAADAPGQDAAGTGPMPANETAGDAAAVREPATRGAVDVARIVERAEYRAATAADEVERAFEAVRGAEAARVATERLRAQQVAREESRVALAALDERTVAVEADRQRLALAREAETLRDVVQGATVAAEAARAAEEHEEALRTAWAAAGEPERSAAELRALVEQLTGELARGADAERVEQALEAEIAAADRLRAEETAVGAEIAASMTERALLEGELAEIETRLPSVIAAAALLEGARARRDAAATRRDAAVRADGLRTRLAEAEVARLGRSQATQAAVQEVTALVRRRLEGFAGELAGALVDGEPCAVCGAVEHPAPAHPAGAPVTEDDVVEAERIRDAALAAENEAAAHAVEMRAAYEAAAAVAGDATSAQAEDALADAARAVVAADAARAERMRDETRRDELVAARDERVRREEQLAAEIAVVRERLARGDARIADARATVDAARGEHPSVAARVAAMTERRERARLRADARAERAARASLAADAEAVRDARIAQTAFADAAAVEAALVERAVQDGLDRSVRAHETAVRVEKERLLGLELELVDAPAETADVDAARAAEADARDRWTRAVQAQAAATELVARLVDLRDRIAAAEGADLERAEAHRVLVRLADTVAGRAPNTKRMSLETFVLAAELEEIVAAANVRLDEMSAGRYRLQHTDALARRNAASGLGLEVMDAYTGRARAPQSLSGGETFLASLALALGLAEVVSARAGGIRLDTLFVDEGFGSLDAETLDLALRTLDALRAGGRTIGVISHVEAMREQLPARIAVEATPQGPSIIRQELPAGVAPALG